MTPASNAPRIRPCRMQSSRYRVDRPTLPVRSRGASTGVRGSQRGRFAGTRCGQAPPLHPRDSMVGDRHTPPPARRRALDTRRLPMTATHDLHELGQSLWIDNITRPMLDSGTLARYIAELDVTGLTSNPTIYDKAIGGSDAYDDEVRPIGRGGRLARGDVLRRRAQRPRPAPRTCSARSTTRRTASTGSCRSRCPRSSPTTATRPSARRSASTRRPAARTCSSRSRARSRA